MNPPKKENLERLYTQKNGDRSFLLVSLYSLIEGYIRSNFKELQYANTKILETDDEKTKKEKKQKQQFFTVLLTLYKYKTKNVRDQEMQQYKKTHGLGYYDLIPQKEMGKIYETVNEQFSDLHSLLFDQINEFHEYTNDVRHYFKKIDPSLIDTAITQFIEFAKEENFYSNKMDKLSDFSDWSNRTAPKETEEYNRILQQMNELTERNKNNEELLARKIIEIENIHQQYENLENLKNDLENEKNSLSKNCDDLRQKAFDLNQTISTLKQQAEKDSSAKEQVIKLTKDLENIKAEKEKQENLLSEKQKEIESLTITNDSLSQKNEIFAKEKVTLEKKYQNLEKEATSIRNEINNLNSNADNNKDRLLALQEDYNKILILKNDQEHQLNEKQAEIDKLNKSYQDLSLMNDDLKNQKKSAEEQLSSYISEAHSLRVKIQELEKDPIDSEKKEEEIKKLQEKYTTLLKEQDNQREFLRQIQEKHLAEVEALKKDAELFIENTRILQAHTSASRNYHARILKLSKEQSDIVNDICMHLEKLKDSDPEKDFLIKGGPGTGKTLVLIKILERFATKIKNKNVKLLTYTDSLSKYNQYLSGEYEKKNPKSKKKVSEFMENNIETFDSYFMPKVSEILGKDSVYKFDIKQKDIENTDQYNNLFEIFNSFEPNKEDARTIMKEAFLEIWTFAPSKEDYISKNYIGDDIVLSENSLKDRKYIWETVEKVSLELEKQKYIPLDFAYYKIATEDKYNLLSDSYKIDYLLIDEIQDLSPSRIKVISKLNKKSCVMAGDLNQSVFIKRGLSWVALGLKLEGKGQINILEKNYRSTINIQKLANKYRELCEIQDDNAISESFIPGQDPEISYSVDIDEALNKILLKIQCYINVIKFNPEDICIVLPSQDELGRIKGLLLDNHITAMAMDDPKFDFHKSKGIVRLSTTKHVKGIDSPVIILLLNENFTDVTKNGNTDSKSQMNSIYSCITRTMDSLYIQITENTLKTNLEDGENSVTKLIKVLK